MTNVWKAPADIDDDDDNLLIDDSDGSDLEVSGLGNSRTNNYSNQGFIQPDHQIESDIPATPAPKSVPTNPTTSANAAAASSSFMSNQPPPAYPRLGIHNHDRRSRGAAPVYGRRYAR